jgi:hypothetical protein
VIDVCPACGGCGYLPGGERCAETGADLGLYCEECESSGVVEVTLDDLRAELERLREHQDEAPTEARGIEAARLEALIELMAGEA